MFMLHIDFGQGIQHIAEFQVVKEMTTPVILGDKWLSTYKLQVDCIDHTLQITSSTGSKVCPSGVGPHCLEPVVALCCGKAAVHQFYKGAATWFLQL